MKIADKWWSEEGLWTMLALFLILVKQRESVQWANDR